MSRLYGKLTSDTRKIDATARANKQISVDLFYGSAKNPQLAVRVYLIWPKGETHPLVETRLSRIVDHVVSVGGERVYEQTL